jgi:hypothetical protein
MQLLTCDSWGMQAWGGELDPTHKPGLMTAEEKAAEEGSKAVSLTENLPGARDVRLMVRTRARSDP